MRVRAFLVPCALAAAGQPAAAALDVAADAARAIAKEAYVYGFPLVDNYRVIHAYAVEQGGPDYKAPFNQLHNTARVYTPADTVIQTPNSDTPYSFAALDLRAEPMVLTLPPIEPNRYYSVQLVDLYTHNFAYLGTRATGNGGGDVLVAGPGWSGEKPQGVAKVVQAETELVLALYRTQLFDAADLPKVHEVQRGYRVRPLSAYAGKAPPPAPPPLQLVKPLTPAEERSSLGFFEVLRAVLALCPTHPSEVDLRARFEKIGVAPATPFVPDALSPELQAALRAGMVDGQKEIDAARAQATSAADLFGTREELKNDYLVRAEAAQSGIYGNTKEEAFYIPYQTSSDGKPLDASKHDYAIRFEPGKLPPANAFWSLTLYDLPAQLLVDNAIDRYLINSPMLPGLKRDPDGGLTLLIQHQPPEGAEANWLPAPKGPFFTVLRIYLPRPEVLNGVWKAPPIAPAGR
jgi:hypothetical protein